MKERGAWLGLEVVFDVFQNFVDEAVVEIDELLDRIVEALWGSVAGVVHLLTVLLVIDLHLLVPTSILVDVVVADVVVACFFGRLALGFELGHLDLFLQLRRDHGQASQGDVEVLKLVENFLILTLEDIFPLELEGVMCRHVSEEKPNVLLFQGRDVVCPENKDTNMSKI